MEIKYPQFNCRIKPQTCNATPTPSQVKIQVIVGMVKHG